MAKGERPLWIQGILRETGRIKENPLFRYLRWSRYTKKSHKKMFKGILMSLKGLAYILVLIASLGVILDIPIGMTVVIILLGLRGIYNLARGTYLMIRANRLARKARGKGEDRKWRYFLLWTNTTSLIVLLSLCFLFVTEQLQAPQDIVGGQKWYVWPFIYLGLFIIWSITVRSLILGGARSFKVGGNLAKIRHDRRLLRSNKGKKGEAFLLFTGYLPLVGLFFMLVMISLLKILLRYLTLIIFDRETANSIGEELIRIATGSHLSLGSIHPFFISWYGPILFYIGVIIMIGIFSNLRTRAMLSSQYRNLYQTKMGRRIDMVKQFRRDRR